MRDLRGGLVRTSLALAVGALALTGCSEKQEASTSLPTPSASETTPELPPLGPADFPVPDEARTKDAAGAEAFLEYWIELLNRQRTIPNGDPIRDLAPECQNCQRIAQNYEEAASAGTSYEGGSIKVDASANATIEGDKATISFLASQDYVQLVDGSGAPVDAGQDAATQLSSGLSLVWSPETSSWLVTGFDLG